MAFLDETGLTTLVRHIKSEIAAVAAEKSNFENATVENNMSVGGSLTVAGREYGVNKVLWSGAIYMTESQTATLSEAISAQPNGIVLVWSYYSNGSAQDSRWSSYFIPKGAVRLHPNELHVCGHIGQTLHMAKWVLISDTSIRGSGSNNGSNFTMDGVTVYNSGFVLRYVIGV